MEVPYTTIERHFRLCLIAASPAQELGAKLATEFCVVELNGRLHPYRIFFPSRYVPAPEKEGGSVPKFPLVIACHPGGGDEHSYFEWKGNADRIQTIAEERGYIVACPAAPGNNWHEDGCGIRIRIRLQEGITRRDHGGRARDHPAASSR